MRGGAVSHSTEGLKVEFSFARDMVRLIIWATARVKTLGVPATAAGRAEQGRRVDLRGGEVT